MLSGLGAVGLVACGGQAPSASPADVQATVAAAVQATTQAAVPRATVVPTAPPASALPRFTNENWGLALADANRYKQASVDLVGKIFLEPQTEGDVTGFQMYTNAKANEGNTLVAARGGPKLKSGDYVRVQGNLVDMYEGTNAFGARLAVPRVAAASVEVIPREQVVAPTLKAYTEIPSATQHGLTIAPQRIELAAEETRVFVKVTNASTERATVYRHQLKLVQGSRQLEPKYSFEANYPDLPSDMLPGVEAETAVLFDAVALDQPLRLVWDGAHLSNFRLTFQPYQWTAG